MSNAVLIPAYTAPRQNREEAETRYHEWVKLITSFGGLPVRSSSLTKYFKLDGCTIGVERISPANIKVQRAIWVVPPIRSGVKDFVVSWDSAATLDLQIKKHVTKQNNP